MCDDVVLRGAGRGRREPGDLLPALPGCQGHFGGGGGSAAVLLRPSLRPATPRASTRWPMRESQSFRERRGRTSPARAPRIFLPCRGGDHGFGDPPLPQQRQDLPLLRCCSERCQGPHPATSFIVKGRSNYFHAVSCVSLQRWGPAQGPASSRRRCAAHLAASWPRPTRRSTCTCSVVIARSVQTLNPNPTHSDSYVLAQPSWHFLFKHAAGLGPRRRFPAQVSGSPWSISIAWPETADNCGRAVQGSQDPKEKRGEVPTGL